MHRYGPLVALLLACGATTPPAAAPPPTAAGVTPAASAASASAASEAFDAVVRVEAGSDTFAGVWLERDDGERWIVADRREAWLDPFLDQRVHVTGEPYAGATSGGLHLRIATLRILDRSSMAALIEVGPEQRLTGSFERRTPPRGSKAEGQAYVVFAVAGGGGEFLLAETPPGVALERRCTITARRVEMSPFVARMGGPTLWVLALEP